MAGKLFVVLLLAVPGHCGFGPETQVKPNPHLVAASSSLLSSMTFGFFASKHYLVFASAVDIFPDTWEFKFHLANAPLRLINLAPLPGSVGGVLSVKRICRPPRVAKPLPFRPTDVPDYSRNNSALLYYYKLSTQKYYTRTVTVVQDSLCKEVATTAADGDATSGCVAPDASATACLHQYDSFQGAEWTMYGVVLYNNVPIGSQTGAVCNVGETAQSSPLEFLKLQGYRSELVANIHFTIK